MMVSTNLTAMGMEDYPEYKASLWLWKVFSPILIIVGTIGNLMAILVLTRSNMRKSTVSIYLCVLSVSDILVLYTGLLRQAIRYNTNYDIRSLSELSCKINTWMVYFTLDFSVWILVAVTIERIISVWFPYRVKHACTTVSACITLSVIGVILLAVNSHFLYGAGFKTSEAKCTSLSADYEHFLDKIWPWMDLCIFCLIPFTVLIIGNISIIFKVYMTKKQKRNLTLPRSQNTQQIETYNRKASSMTAMLLCLNIVFLTTTSPISVYLIGEPYWTEDLDPQGEARHALIWAIVNLLMYTSNSINFILYCVSGSRFREELYSLFKKNNRVQPLKISSTRENKLQRSFELQETKSGPTERADDNV